MITLVFLVAAYFLTAPIVAEAYIDPGLGSFIIQAIVAAVFGFLVYLRIFWTKIKGVFTRRNTVLPPEKNTAPNVETQQYDGEKR